MSTRATLILGVIFAVLLGAFVVTGRRERQFERQQSESRKVFEFAASDIKTISIQQRGAEPVEAVRTDRGWEFAGAYRHIRPNGALWDQLAEVMTVARNERTIAGAEDDLEAFELDPPQLTVVVGTKQGTAYQVDFGGLDPTQRHRYHRMADQGVFLSSADWFAIMNRDLGILRDRHVFQNLADGLTRFEYKRYLVESEDDAEVSDDLQKRMAGIDEAYAKTDTGAWRLVSPVDAVARQDRLELLERVLPTLGGRAYIDDPESLSDYGLDRPFAEMTVLGPSGIGETLLLGGIDSGDVAEGEAGLYVRREDDRSVIMVDARLFTLLPAEPQAFRERRLFTREALGLTSIRYRDNASEFTLLNGEEGWLLEGAPSGETDQVAVSMYIARLKRAEGTASPDEVSPEAFGAPRITLEFTFSEGADSRIEIGAPIPGTEPMEFYARQDFGSVTTIPFEVFQSLRAAPFDFREKSLVTIDPKSVNRLELMLEGTRYVFVRADGRWGVSEPAGARLEAQSDLTAFLATLSNLRALGIADPPPPADVQGVDAPLMEVTLQSEVPTESPIGPIRIGRLKTDASRERFATVADNTTVYFVDQSVVDAGRELVTRVRSTDAQNN